MTNRTKDITRLFRVIDRSLFTTRGRLDYGRITDAITHLADMVHTYPEEIESIWDIGEGGACNLADLIVGAYWHYYEGQASIGISSYRALCALGNVFSPGMSCAEDDNAAYIALNSLATEHFLQMINQLDK